MIYMSGPFPPPGSTHKWAGRAVTNARAWYATTHGIDTCARCGQPITGPWVLGHRLDRQAHPELTWHPDNWQAEHRRCSDSSGARQGNQRRRIRKAKSPAMNENARFFSRTPAAPPLPANINANNAGMRVAIPRLHPDGFPYPRVETPERPGTDHGLAEQVLEWIAANAPGPPLLPWERYVIWRGLETQRGRLWRNVAFLVSRQQGKTYLMQRLMLARLHLADLLGSPAILNTHPDVSQAVELVEMFARDLGTGYLRARANGADWWVDAESVVDIGKGRVWRARAQTRGAITGQAGVGMVFVDEVQSARQPVIDRTVRPILSGARVVNPQAWFAGTGERDESEVLRQLRGAGARGGDTLWLEWSAPPGCDTGDEVAWWWASPDWSENRRETLASDLHHMQEVDFRSEYLVQHDAQVTLWMPRPVVAACGRPVVSPQPLVGALEVGTDQVSWSAAVSDGQQVATLVGGSLPDVVAWLVGWNVPVVLAHMAVVQRPELARLAAQLVGVKVHEVAAAAAELGDAVRGATVTFDNPDVVGAAFARVVIGRVDGLRRIVDSQSRGDVSVVKAMSWALWFARQHAPEPSMVF